jgi:hypothetical protein
MAEEVSSTKEPLWITPAKALARVERAVQNPYTAADILVKWLRDDLVTAFAKHVVVQEGDEQKRNADILVRAYVWNHLKGDAKSQEFWQTEHLEVWLDRGETRVSYYGLRFDANAISQHLPDVPRRKPDDFARTLAKRVRAENEAARQTTSPPPPAAPKQEDVQQTEDSAPPVSLSHLKQWHELYLLVYPEAEDTEALAWASAKGMFQGKSVSRNAIRNLRGERKRGRKATAK